MDAIQQWFDEVTGPATQALSSVSDWLYTYVMIACLAGTGIYLTLRSRALQVRHFSAMFRYLMRSRKGANGGISSFQAFAIGMATRIGIGNITGVALALILGGPGALFWMWVAAFLGMATAFAEATLAQIFKIPHHDGTFRGGPMAYMRYGLKSRSLAIVFTLAMVFTMVVAMPMVQSNTIAQVMAASRDVPAWVTAVVVSILAALVLLGGVRSVARATEFISPIMAVVYLVVALSVVAVNFRQIPQFFTDVFLSAFGMREAAAGVAGGIMAAIMNGLRRGLFSNEAGMGTNPNAAATATVAHPVQQGLIQSLGVFFDTMVICTATGFIIMTSGLLDRTVLSPDDAGHLTTSAITQSLGAWMAWPIAIIIFFFGFSSILGAYAYGEASLVFLRAGAKVHFAAKVLTIVFSALGALLALTFVWALMDLTMFVVTMINLFTVLALGSWVIVAMRDYESQVARIRRNGYLEVASRDGARMIRVIEPVFQPDALDVPRDYDAKAWEKAVESAQHLS
ncbi:alanine/glycine:cation symporter family protein [Trueperella sp. LYQ141]|uniref:alanine/glycine:cation symporter family protein n=1 Tax=Trueperella sp. LYQ141 TaxID=3391058 RepID=UPI003982D791